MSVYSIQVEDPILDTSLLRQGRTSLGALRFFRM